MQRYQQDEFGDEFTQVPIPSNYVPAGAQHFDAAYDDAETEGGAMTSGQYVPEQVKQFLAYLYRNIKERKVHDLHAMYDSSFNQLTEKYFKKEPWPPAEVVASIFHGDQLVTTLYKELYFRHIYGKFTPTIEQRFASWKNYWDLFNLLLNETPNLELELPTQWMWDIIDEFIYQYQTFCQYRSKIKSLKPDELTQLKNNPQVWSTTSVIAFLQQLVNKANTIQTLDKIKKGVVETSTEPSFSNHPVYRVLGQFSLVGLLRVHCLLGDYHLALKTISHVELSVHRDLFSRSAACHVTLYYYLGFVYFMSRRYVDAIRIYSSALLYISRAKQFHSRSSQYDQISKKNDQMFAFLAISLSLCPQRVDENIHTALRDKYSEKMAKLQRGDESTFEELFIYACPKFVSPAPLNYAAILEDPKLQQQNYLQEALNLQTKVFLLDVKQQGLVPTIRSFLKLYTTISTSKLSTFLEVDEKNLGTHLMCAKNKTRNLVWTTGSPVNGEWVYSSDVDFYIDKDMVHISDSKVQRRYSEFFIRHIQKFDEIIKDVKPGQS